MLDAVFVMSEECNQNETDPSKYLRENLKDLQEYAKKRLQNKGKKPQGEADTDSALWNIRNWGNFWDSNPSFYNH